MTIIDFIKNYPELVILMKQTEHNSKYHLEGDVWTHTCMAYMYAVAKYPSNKNLHLACLLHDIGKPQAHYRNDYKHFATHEAISTQMAIDILTEMAVEANDIIDIVTAINLHGVNHSQLEVTPLTKLLRECDSASGLYDGVREDYTERNFLKYKPTKEQTVTLLVGLPNIGKSTYSKDKNTFSRDDIITSLCPGMTYNQAYQYVHSTPELKEKLQAQFQKALKTKLSSGQDFIVDMTNLTLKGRRNIMNQLQGARFKAVVFLSPTTTIQARNDKREGKYISQSVYDFMIPSFVLPVKEEGFDDIQIIYTKD